MEASSLDDLIIDEGQPSVSQAAPASVPAVTPAVIPPPLLSVESDFASEPQTIAPLPSKTQQPEVEAEVSLQPAEVPSLTPETPSILPPTSDASSIGVPTQPSQVISDSSSSTDHPSQPKHADEPHEADEEEEDESSEEGEDEDDDDDDDDDEEEEEPKLKYQRLGASVTGILKKDAAKCILAHEKFLVLGTASGRLYILDLNGNEILQFHPHTQAINDLSLDLNGDHVASCSNDGTVVITNLFTKEVSKHAYPRGIKSVALPGHYKNNSMFACGGAEGKFIINTKGWFSNKDNVIHHGEGPIHAIKWRMELLAWGNDAGVKIYDVNTSERITHIARGDTSNPNASAPPPAEMFKCNLCWSRDDTILIGWADSVKIGVVKSRASGPVGSGGGTSNSNRPGTVAGPAQPSQNRYVQIVAMFTTEYMICGIAPWGPHHLVLMAFLEDEADSNSNSSSSASSAVSAKSRVARATSTDDAAGAPSTSASGANTPSGGSRLSTTIGPNGMRLPRPGNSQRPELRIVTLTNEEVSADALPIMGYANYMAQDYRLDFNPNGSGISAPPVHPSAAAALGHVASAVGVPSNSAIGPAAASNANTASNKAAAAAAAASANLDYLFYILAPHDIVVAKPRDYDDHITWLLARSKYEEALHYAHSFSAQLKIHNSYEIGENFLKYLFEVEKNYIKAAEYCSKLLGNSKSLWETYILLFAKHDKLSYIAPVIPVANPTLSDHIYELVLNSYLHQTETHGKLLTLIKTWSHHLYHIKHVIESIRLKLVEMENSEKEREKKMGREAYWKEQQEQDKAEEAAKAQKDKEAALEAEKEKESKLQQEQQDDESKKNSKAHIFAAALAAANAASSSKSGQLDSRLYPAAPLLPPRSMRVLYESLAELYVLNKQYSQAFDIYLKLQRKDELFRILTTFSHQLLESKLLDERNIVLLMKINLHSTLELLLNFQERIQTKDVMEQLKQAQYNAEKNQAASPAAPGGAAVVQPTYKVFQYEYLHALFRKDHSLGQKFHDEQVLLYAEFNPKELLYFLKNSSGYLLEKALESCEKYKLYSEMVFLLKRMGNTNMALKLIIDELHDVKEAINFVEENGGRSNNNNGRGGGGDGDEGEGNSLWEELITRSLNNPLFLSDLLEHVGSHYVDLSKLIQRIPPTLEIPSLKQKLITILNDCELQQSVIKGCTNILRNDCKNLIERLYRRRKRAMKIPVGTKCSVCDVEIVSANGQVSEGNASAGAASGGSGNLGAGVLIFFCRHVMHRSCYDSQRSAGERRNDTQCPKCNAHSAAHGHTPNTYTAPQQQQQQQQPQPLPSAGKFSGLSTPSVARMAGHAPPPQMASTPHKRSGSSVPSASPPSAGFPSRSPSSSQSPATNYQRSILPAPSPNAVGPASHLKRPVIPLPQSANVLPRGAVAGSATTPSASTPSSSASAAVSHVRSASPLVGGGTGSPNPALMTPTGHTPTAINAIKPQAAFNRPPSNRNSVSMGKP